MVLQLIARARRRLLYNALAAEAARAATVAAALLIVLLVLGTDILGWRWLVVMPAAALAAGACLAIRRLPDLYRTARIVDIRMRLSDMLATALFSAAPEAERRFDPVMRRAHIESAETAVRGVRAADAVPFHTPRLLYAAVPLALLAGSLFVMRYVWQDELDLRQPLPIAARYLLRLSKLDLSAFIGHKERPPRPETPEQENFEDGEGPTPGGKQPSGAAHEKEPSQSQDQARGAKESQAGNGDAFAEDIQQKSGDPQGDARRGEQQADSSGQDSRQQDTNASLTDKLRDAVRGMLSRMGAESSGGRDGQSAPRNAQARPGGSRMEQGNGGQFSSRQSTAQTSGPSQPAEGHQGQGKGSSAAASASQGDSTDKQPGNSAGSNDGSKDLKQAEQLAAMGKISVILGKRSETVSGNATLETVSGKQNLITPYASARNEHAQSNVAIERDEVPVGLEDYVQRYFAAVRSRRSK